jgi:hypothetical protein
MRTLAHDDMLAPLAGQLSGCCQHLHDGARYAAANAYNSHHSAICAVFDERGNMVAQSWVYRTKDDSIVFDSVEQRRAYSVYIPEIFTRNVWVNARDT